MIPVPFWLWVILVVIGVISWIVKLVYLKPKRRRERIGRKNQQYGA
jgi:hypothetical protein